MKLTNFYSDGERSALGIVEDSRILDLTKLSGHDAAFVSVAQWLRSGDNIRSRTDALLDRAKANRNIWQSLDDVKFAPLLDRNSRIFCVGLNYADHAAEVKAAIPTSPVFFYKLASVVVPHGAAVLLPSTSKQVDYEAEFAFVVGRRAKNVSEEDAAGYIAGYTIMNDVSARDMQFHDGQWFRGKNCDTFAPMGPWLVTADEIPSPGRLSIQLRLNGEVRQNSNTSNLVFGPAKLLSFLSQSLTLESGDAISTGTPGGIGYYSDPKVFLQPGDVMEIEIEQIGQLRNTVAR